MMGAPVVHWEIIGRDANQLHSFYSELFDWKINSDNPMSYGLVEAQREGTIGGGIGQADEGQTGHVTFYVEVENPEEYLKRVEKLGGKVIVPVTEVPNMVTFALFADPEGHMVGLVKSA
jgi:predicted enzyme related to lactoylglutathione lyase